MPSEQSFINLGAISARLLNELSMSVRTIISESVETWKLNSSSLIRDGKEPEVVAKVKKWAEGGSAFLYFLSLSQNDKLAEIEAAFSLSKAKENKERQYSRLNSHNTCLYVGSSRDLSKRLKEHLGFGQPKTYSLQLAQWAQPLSLELEFVCARYSSSTQGEILQTLEDTLWTSSKPMFGRRGSK